MKIIFGGVEKVKYVLSDIHGHYNTFMAMLEQIKFSDEDTLYIIGDLCDRGKKNKAVLDYVMGHTENIHCLMGNHDLYMLKWLFFKTVKDYKDPDGDYYCARDVLWKWNPNGGGETVKELEEAGGRYMIKVRAFLRKLPYYKVLGNTVLVHGGIYNHIFREGDEPADISPETLMKKQLNQDMVWARPTKHMYGYNMTFNKDIKFVVGHTPTRHFTPHYEDDIFVKGNTTFIDCGIAWGGRLGCMCLDTGEYFYQDNIDEPEKIDSWC